MWSLRRGANEASCGDQELWWGSGGEEQTKLRAVAIKRHAETPTVNIKDIFLLNLSMKCCNSVPAFNAQGSRVIIIVVQLGAVKIYVAASGGAQEKGKTR